MRGLLCVAIILSSAFVKAQLIVIPNPTAAEMADKLTGKGIKILNPSVTAATVSYGIYNATATNLNSPEGVLLTTGNINNAIGPNNTENKSTDNNFQGNTLLDQKTGKTTYDAAMLEFDVIPSGNNINFKFVFASEEYEEWVGSQYNDVFGFYISGPGITGEQNIALVPGTSTEVSINTVNGNTNSAYYKKNNSNGGNGNSSNNTIQYDGFTKDLFANITVTACQKYRLKLIIADVSDRLWDSGVFIEKLESKGVSLTLANAGNIPTLIEGCNNGSVVFTRDDVNASPLNLQFTLDGTAINGTDYSQIGSSPAPGTINNITIPANQASVSVNIQTIADGIAEGAENIMVYLINPYCPGQIIDSLNIILNDALVADITPATDTLCLGGGVQLVATGGNTFSWTPASGLSNSNIYNPIASPTKTTVYTVTTTAGNCTAKDSIQIFVSDIALSFNTINVLCYGGSTGSIDLNVTGIAPFQYSWTGPNGFTANTQDLTNIKSGTYTVNVLGSNGCSAIKEVSVTQPNEIIVNISTTNSNHCQASNGTITVKAFGGKNPYTYQWSDGATGPTRKGLKPGTYIVTVTDGNGCTKSATAVVGNDNDSQVLTANITSTPVTCYGGNNGTATVTVTNTSPSELVGLTYLWSNGATTATITGLTSGYYTVTVTNVKKCSSSYSVFVSQPKSIVYSINTTNVSCFGGNDGTAAINATGGTLPYTYSWATNPVKTTPSVTGLTAGSYSVTVRDSNNCIITAKATITQPTLLTATVSSQTNVLCKGNATGSATISTSGGTPAYTYLWTTNPAQTTATATGLTAGTYSCTVTDAKKCIYTISVTITEPATVISASVNVTNINCYGSSTGSAVITASGGTGSYSYTWNTSPVQYGASITNMPAGNYECAVKDQNGCSITVPAVITQPSQALSATVTSQTNILCKGNATGVVTVNATGGTPGYTYTWNTSPVQTGSTASGLTAGAYTITINDSKNCSLQLNIVITEPTQALTASLGAQTNVLCNGDKTGTATVNVSGGTGSYSYSWNTSPIQTTPTATGLGAGSYTSTITDVNNCSSSVNITITEPSQPLTAIVSQTDIKCFGNTNGTASVTASGGSGSYSYVWSTSPVNYSANVTGLAAGNYTVTVADNNGCTKNVVLTANITQPAALSATSVLSDYTGFNISCNGFNDGSINLTVSGGVLPYIYTWTGPPGFNSANEDITGLYAGTYNLNIKDANNCSVNYSYSLTEPAPIDFTGSVTNATCQNNDGSVSISVVGVGTYNFDWTGPGGFASSSKSISNLAPGIYTVMITNNTKCSVESYEITRPGTIATSFTESIFPNGMNISCYGVNDGSINTNVTGGTSPYTFLWSGPAAYLSASKDISGLYAGQYILRITDNQGCYRNDTVVLAQPADIIGVLTPSIFMGGYNINCFGNNTGTINTSISGGLSPYQYSWTGPLGFTSSSADISGLYAGNYQLMVTDASNCKKTFNVTLTQPNQLTTVTTPYTFAGGYNISCNGTATGSITTVTNGGQVPYTFSWTGPGSFSSSSSNISNLFAGAYSLNISDANGCTITSSQNLIEPAALNTSLNASLFTGGYNIDCYGNSTGSISSATIGGSPGYFYSWTGPAGFTANSQNLANLIAGDYSVTITDINGCKINSAVTLTEPSQPLSITLSSPNFTGGYNIDCNGSNTGAINVTVSGGTPNLSFSWTGPNGFTSSSMNLINVVAGTYSLTAVDTNGCSANGSITLTQPAEFSTSATSPLYNGVNISCKGGNNGAVNLTYLGGTPSYLFAWTGPSGYSSTLQNISGLISGTYSVIITDANNCTASTSITLMEPDSLTSTIDSYVYNGGYNVSCNSATDGIINFSVSGGIGPYTYSWSNLENTQNINNVPAGLYTVTVTDKNNCTLTDSVLLTEPALLTDSLTAFGYPGGKNVSCFNAADGSINVTVSGGTSPYAFNWSGPDNFTAAEQNIDSLEAGNYNVIITDANGCFNNSNIILSTPAQLNVAVSALTKNGGINISCKGEKDGEIFSVVGGGTPGYDYLWSGPAGFTSNEGSLDSIPAGTYSLLVTDTNNCTANASVALTEPDSLKLVPAVSIFGSTNISCFGGNNGSININAAGGSQPYKSIWMGPNNFSDTINVSITNLFAGDYSLFINDVNGCFAILDLTLTQPSPLSDSLIALTYTGGNNISCFGAGDGKINQFVSGGTSPYIIDWSGPSGFTSNTDSLVNIPAGIYLISFTDANGCTLNDSITLTQPQPINLSLTSTLTNGFNIACKGTSTGDLQLNTTGGTPGYVISWTGPSNFTSSLNSLSGLIAGTYSLTVRDTNACVADTTVTLTEPADTITSTTTVSIYNGYNISCYGKNDGYINLYSTGGTPGYYVAWRGPEGFIANTGNISGLIFGSYSATITDNNGCVNNLSVTLTQPDSISAATTSTEPVCENVNGSITLTNSGGVIPYTYLWSTGATTQNLTAATGSYTVTITDKNNCTKQVSEIIKEGKTLEITEAVTHVDCYGDSTGAIDITVVKGAQPITYLWSIGTSVQDIINLPAGEYKLRVTDYNGCRIDKTYTVNQNDQLTASLNISTFPGNYNISGYNKNDGYIDLTVGGGVTPYSYQWSTGANSEDLSNLGEGTYLVNIIDDKGCKISAQGSLKQPPALTMPTGFSPNGDGKNDTFVVIGLEAYPDNEIVIVNRWGNEVFTKKGYQNDWTGVNTGGEQLPDATYFVILKINNGSTTLTGYVDMRRQ